MGKLLKLTFVAGIFFLLMPFAMRAGNLKGFYTFDMSVEKNGVEITSGITMLNVDMPKPNCTGVFIDSLSNIGLGFSVQPTHIGVGIQNMGDKTIRVDWENSVFISINNRTHRIFHKGVPAISRDEEQRPTPIAKGAILSDVIVPTANVFYSSSFSRWMYSYLLDYQNGTYDGGTIKIMITIQTDEEVYEYLFSLTLKYHQAKAKTFFDGEYREWFR